MVYYFHTSHRNYLLLLTDPGDCTKQEMSKGVAKKVLKFVSEDACKSLVIYSELSTPRTGNVVR